MDTSILNSCEKCLHDEPAACTASCPLHIDIVSLTDEIGRGEFKKAYKILEKRMPFAGIFAVICDHPCEKVCVREQTDSPIRISELERAAVKYGKAPFKKVLSVPKTVGKAAVIGGGISGIVVACELDKKGFEVTIFEKSDKLGGHIWDFEGCPLSSEEIKEELDLINKLGIKVVYNREISAEDLKEIMAEYAAVFLGTGTWASALSVNPNTFQVGESSLFAGGGICDESGSVIKAISSGKRAAISIERYVKKVSMTASREREGSFETPMKYNMDDIVPSDATEKTQDYYTEEEARREAERCLKCRCEDCVKACSHLRKFGMTPKSYARQIQINESVIMGTRYANKMINSCAMCGLCGEQCPIGIGMDDIIRQTRQSMVEKGKMPQSAHDFALRDMEFSNSEQFYMVRTHPLQKSGASYCCGNGEKYLEKSSYIFFPGCQLSASSPENVEGAYKYLISNIKEGVGLMLGCCGAPADWSGRKDLMEQNAERFRGAWNENGKPVFILACSSCAAVFDRFMPEIPHISLWEIIDRYGLPENAEQGNGHILSVHDACTARNDSVTQRSLRNIAKKLNYEINELKYSGDHTRCCGYGGLVWYANAEQAQGFVKDRISESREDYLVYCAMCKDLFVEGGKRTYHILDLLFNSDLENAPIRRMPNFSERHSNRTDLRKKLLKEFWNEGFDDKATRKSEYAISDEVWHVMDKRYILLEDVEKVIESSRNLGERFYNPEDSSYLASLRLGSVTYWVRYSEDNGKPRIISVYSHRMEVVKE